MASEESGAAAAPTGQQQAGEGDPKNVEDLTAFVSGFSLISWLFFADGLNCGCF